MPACSRRDESRSETVSASEPHTSSSSRCSLTILHVSHPYLVSHSFYIRPYRPLISNSEEFLFTCIYMLSSSGLSISNNQTRTMQIRAKGIELANTKRICTNKTILFRFYFFMSVFVYLRRRCFPAFQDNVYLPFHTTGVSLIIIALMEALGIYARGLLS